METVTRKRLGKAVLLSLLLMNVCKEGGATEYNAAITGNETDYDSIKEVDIVSGDIAEIANRIRCVPDEFITPDGCGITDAGIEYLLPLIQGEPELVYENGLPKHFEIKRTNS